MFYLFSSSSSSSCSSVHESSPPSLRSPIGIPPVHFRVSSQSISLDFHTIQDNQSWIAWKTIKSPQTSLLFPNVFLSGHTFLCSTVCPFTHTVEDIVIMFNVFAWFGRSFAKTDENVLFEML